MYEEKLEKGQKSKQNNDKNNNGKTQ